MFEFRAMTEADIPTALALWSGTPGITLRGADSPESLARYLARNPGLSTVAQHGTAIAGLALVGHDGRRGYLHHVVVAPAYRRRGLGRLLVQRCLDNLLAEGIAKCHIFVNADNESGRQFWQAIGWSARAGLQLMSITMGDENA